MSLPDVDTSINTLNIDKVKQKFAQLEIRSVTHLKYFLFSVANIIYINSIIYITFFLLLIGYIH